MQKIVLQENDHTISEFVLDTEWKKQLFLDFIQGFYKTVLNSPSTSEKEQIKYAPPTFSPRDVNHHIQFAGGHVIMGMEPLEVVTEANTGKRMVLRWGEKYITGNTIATLQAIHALGGTYGGVADLVPLLEKNARYELGVGVESIRGQIRYLKENKLLDGNTLNDTARKMAESVKVMEKQEIPEFDPIIKITS